MSYNRPKVAGLDDETGEALTKRPDDNPVRLYLLFTFIHSVLTGPIANFCSPAGRVLRVHFAITHVFFKIGSIFRGPSAEP